MRERVSALGRELMASILRWKWVWLAGVGSLLTFSHFFTIGFNATESLPHVMYLVMKQDRHIERGDYITFRWHGGGPYGKGVSFTKIVRGIPGDEVTVQGRSFYVNGEFVATAKTHARTGQPLQLGPTGVIPPGRYLVFAPNPDSLDSRYALTGWIAEEQVVGRAVPLF